MATLFHVLARMPLGLLHGLGWLAGWLAFLLASHYRHQFVCNAALAGISWRDRMRAIGHAGQMALELPRLWLGAPVCIQWEGDAAIDAAFAAGQGVVFLTPHLGCFEVTAQAYAARYGVLQARPITVLFRPPRKAWLRHIVERARARPGLHTAPTSVAGVKQLIAALRARACVGLLPDQVPATGLGQWAPFFGREAYTMTLSARLAQQTGAAVLLAWGERLGFGAGYTIHVRALPAPLASDLPSAVQQINRAMESLILECPSQYLWGYDRYKAPKAEHGGRAV